jgi:hypothetical protein
MDFDQEMGLENKKRIREADPKGWPLFKLKKV